MAAADGVISPADGLPEALADLLRKSAERTAISGWWDDDALLELRRSGLLAAAAPAEYGGAGKDAVAVNEVVEQVARVNPSVAIIAYQHFAVCMRIAEWGTQQQKEALLPAMSAGDLVAGSAWSEPGVGAAKRKVNTVAARLPGGKWQIDGKKSFTTSAGVADIYLVLAQTSDSDDHANLYGSAGQSFFLVRADNPGLVPAPPLNLVGMRGSATGSIAFRECLVDDADRLGPEGHAPVIIAGVRQAGMTLGAVAVGIARSLLDIAAAHARRGSPDKQTANRQRLADLATQVAAAEALVCQAGLRTSADPGRTTLHSKLFASAMAEHVAAEVARMVGSAGYLADHEINRLTADASAVAHMGPANDLCRELISASWSE